MERNRGILFDLMLETGIKGPTHWGSKGVVDIDGGNEV